MLTYREKIITWIRSRSSQVAAPAPAAWAIPGKDYAETIEELVKKSKKHHSRTPFEQGPTEKLLLALGCRCMDTGRRECLSEVYSPPAEYEQLVRVTLKEALHRCFENNILTWESRDAIALLDGFTKNDRWRDCLEDVDSALELTRLLVAFTHGVKAGGVFNSDVPLRYAVLPAACALLNTWLGRHEAFVGVFGAAEVARALFGDAWCDLALDSDAASVKVAKMITLHRPPFVHGLLPDGIETAAEDLPSLDL
jgi:hypothetical protein